MDESTPETFDSVEEEARSLGWKPEEEWAGNPPANGFLDAETYVDRTRPLIPLMKKQGKQQKKEIDALKTELSKLQTTAAQFQTFAQQAMDRDRRDMERYKVELESKRATAISEGDGEAAVAAERELSQMQSQPPPNTVPPEAQLLVGRWMSENEWYGTDPVLRDWADGRADRLKAENYPAGPAILEIISREVKEAFPERFNSAVHSTVEGKGRRTAQTFGRKSFDDLPEDAQRQYAEFKELIPKFTKKEFVDQYDWDD